MIVYKIRNKTTGLYSRGGKDASLSSLRSWNKTGKTWNTQAALKNHLNLYMKKPWKIRPPNFEWGIPKEWEVVVIEISEVTLSTMLVHDFMK